MIWNCSLLLVLSFLSVNVLSQNPILYQPADSNDNVLPLILANGDDGQIDAQNYAPLLSADQEVFNQFTSFTFSQARFRQRQLDATQQLVTLNGLVLNDPATGLFQRSNWTGLNEVLRVSQSGNGITASPFGFGGGLGYSALDARAAGLTKRSRGAWSVSNQLFRTRWSVSHSSGLTRRNWAYSFLLSGQHGKQYVPGTSINATAVFFSIGKRIGKHDLNVCWFFAPVQRAGSSSILKETAVLSGSNYYNPNWGFQSGTARNAAWSWSKAPWLIADHAFKITHGLQLVSALGLNRGESGTTGLNWYQTEDPRPDYYRYLPSYPLSTGDSVMAQEVTEQWQNNLDTRQIHWDELIALNKANLYSLPGQNQINTTETRARYVVEDRVTRNTTAVFNSKLTKRTEKYNCTAGLQITHYRSQRFKRLNDLLGASYWLDYDQFAASGSPDPATQQNNLDEPDKKIHEGDRFGYDYALHIEKQDMWALYEQQVPKGQWFVSGQINHNTTWREGLVANGKFPDDSTGQSQRLQFTGLGAKAGYQQQLFRKQYFSAALMYQQRAPLVGQAFVTPELCNRTLAGLRPERLRSFELTWTVRHTSFRTKATLWAVAVSDQTRINTYWSDVSNTFINYILTGVRQRQYGVELGAEKTIFDDHTLQLAIALSDCRYNSRPSAQAWRNSTGEALFEGRTIYLNNFVATQSPQTCIGASYRYTSGGRWQAGITAAWYDRTYVSINPDRRSAEALTNFTSSDEAAYTPILRQERLPSWLSIDSRIGRSIRGRGYSIYLFVSINNVLNTQNIITSGSEQFRWDPQFPDRFANRYTWLPGRTWLFTSSLIF